MTSDVISCYPNDTLDSVKDKIVNNLIHHIPVVENEKVVGIISKSDLHRMEHHFTLFENPEAEQSNIQIFSTILAKEIMATPVICIREDEPVNAAVEVFLENTLHALPVVNHDDHLVGIVTTFDLIRFSFAKD